MVFEPVYQKINALCARKESSVQTVVENIFTLENSEEILKIDSSCLVAKTEIAEGFIKIDGSIEYKVLYFNEDKTLKCERFSCEFTAKAPTQVKSGEVSAECIVVDSGISSIGESEIKISSVIDCNLTVFYTEEISALCPTSSGFYLKDCDERFVECKKKDKARTEYSLSDKAVLDEVVCCKGKVVITKRNPMVESVNVDGEILLENIGLKNGEVCCQTISLPFSETFELEGVSYGDIIDVCACVTYCDSAIIEQVDGKKLDGVVKCTFDLLSYKESEFNCVTDVFSVSNQLLPTVKSHTICDKIGSYTVLERVDGTVQLGDNMPVCDVILTSCGYECVVSSALCEDGCVKIEGVIEGKLSYSCSSPLQTVHTTISTPFVISALLPVKSGDKANVKGEVTAVNCRVRRGSEIDVKADIALDIRAFSDKQIAVISSLELGEDIIVPTSAFSVYIAEGGESLWDVSSILGVFPEEIMQNTTLSFPLAKGDRITVYRALDSKKI